MNLFSQSRLWRRFAIHISALVTVFVVMIFIGLFFRDRQLQETELKNRARAHYHNMLVARMWNAKYGGVYVEKKKGVTSNPHLKDPDLLANDGTLLTKKNPALMTREISQLSNQFTGLEFHLTSLNPLNPNNAPTPFERQALLQFEQGKREVFRRQNRNHRTYFSYMAPLLVEEGCIYCHAEQGYKPGDIRGGLSVAFDITDAEATRAENKATIIITAILCGLFLLGFIYLFVGRLMKNLNLAQTKIEQLAVTDDLTQLFNRRHFFDVLKKRSLAPIVMDER